MKVIARSNKERCEADMKLLASRGILAILGSAVFILSIGFALWIWIAEDSMFGIVLLAMLGLVMDDLHKKYSSPKAE